jgi:SPP1 family predicted phage head-tail adaptor
MIATGTRDKRVSLANPSGDLPDGEGGYVPGWAPLEPADVFAHINPASATDLERAAVGVTVAQATHVIAILYHPQVSVHTRITYGTRQFSVTSVRNPDEANRELIVVASELLP